MINRYVDTKRQNMEVNMTEKRSLVSYHSVKRNWKKEDHKELCTREERKEIMW
jgi:hypothetical protein